MAQQEEPLYDFPEPSQASEQKRLLHQRGRGSLRSISVLDRLLLTVPVWLQLSINPATALHILQREPPGTFLVRKSRTSQRNVLCVRLADDSVPSFVQQFGIREESTSKTLCLETSAISFPDLPRLISFYCVSRDVLPFPLELPEAIAKASSHKELESISHMGIEFWNSHLNIRGPREAPKTQKPEQALPDPGTPAPPTSAPPPAATPAAPQTDAAPPTGPEDLLQAEPSDSAAKQPPNPTLFHEFCPITTRSPRELDCGSGLGALCFINPLFLQSQNPLSRRRMFKRSLKVRISTESSTLLSPPLLPPPPPPLMPKTKGKCKRVQGTPHPGTKPKPEAEKPDPSQDLEEEPVVQLPTVMEQLQEDSDYMQPSPLINFPHSPLEAPYLSPSVSPMAPPPLFPKVSSSLSLKDSPGASPSLSPYQSPCLSPRAPFSLSPYDSPSASPSISPYQSPSPSPKANFSLSPFTSPSLSQLAEQVYQTPATPMRADRPGGEEEEEEGEEEEEQGMSVLMNTVVLSDSDSCSSFSSLEGAAETPNKQENGTSL